MLDHPAANITIEPLPITQYYDLIRSQIEHEDTLMVQRLNWFLTSQSFFFTAYAIDVTSLCAVPPAPGVSSETRLLLRVLIPAVAITASVLIFLSIAAGVMAMHNLRKLFRQHIEKARQFDLPPVQGYRTTWTLGLAAPLLLPLVFLCVWLFLLKQAH